MWLKVAYLLICSSLPINILMAHPQLALMAHVALPEIEDYDLHPQYSYGYEVKDILTGDDKHQYETRDGDIIRGSYSFIEADGTKRIVEYTADSINGFNAIVRNLFIKTYN